MRLAEEDILPRNYLEEGIGYRLDVRKFVC